MNFLKSKKLWIIVGVIVFVFLSYIMGVMTSDNMTKTENGTYTELVEKNAGLKKENEKLVEDIYEKEKLVDKKNDEITYLNNDLTEAREVISDADDKEAQSVKLDSDIDNKKKELDGVKKEVGAKQAELDKITNGIAAKKEAPIVLPAGQYIVGKDVPAGRYKATHVDRGSNFFVYDSSGSAIVNTILGNSAVGSGDYVFFTEEGHVIESRAQVKLIPVE